MKINEREHNAINIFLAISFAHMLWLDSATHVLPVYPLFITMAATFIVFLAVAKRVINV